MTLSKSLILILIAAALLAPVALAQGDAPLRIVATTTQAADLARVLTQDLPEGTVEITGLMGAGVDPHLYKPTESDVRAMSRAQVIIYSGLHLEGQFDTVFESLAERGVMIFALSAPVDAEGYVMNVEDGDVADPHFWFDPRNWALSAQALADVLAKADPDHAEQYQANAAAYIEQLDTLFAWAQEGMAQVPEAQRYIVTSHDAFQYFGTAFGWQMQSIQGISTADEAGVGDIQGVVDFIIAHEIPVIFVESSVPPTTIEAVQDAVRAARGDVALGIRELYSDAMGDPDTFGGTYIGMTAENVYTILQSYQRQGIAIEIPPFPPSLMPEPKDAQLIPNFDLTD